MKQSFFRAWELAWGVAVFSTKFEAISFPSLVLVEHFYSLFGWNFGLREINADGKSILHFFSFDLTITNTYFMKRDKNLIAYKNRRTRSPIYFFLFEVNLFLGIARGGVPFSWEIWSNHFSLFNGCSILSVKRFHSLFRRMFGLREINMDGKSILNFWFAFDLTTTNMCFMKKKD